MKHQIKSSVFSSVNYISKDQSLFVDFNSGYTYEYLNVPRSMFTDLLISESKGKYFNKNIRDNFKYIRR